MALERVGDADDRALRHVRVSGEHFLHGAGRQAVAGHVDHVIDAGHDPDIAVAIDEAGVARQVVAGVATQVALAVTLIVPPQRRQRAGRQRQTDHDVADLPGGHGRARGVQYPHVIARHRHARRARLDRERREPPAVCHDRPAGLGLPPVIDHRHPEFLLGPVHGVGVTALTGQKQRIEAREVVAADERSARILPLDGAKRGRRREQGVDPMLRDDAPEGAGVRSADRLAFVEDAGAAGEQRRVDDVRVADHPADVGGRPEHISRPHAVDRLHRPREGNRVPPVIAHHALRLAGRARGVEDVKRIGGLERCARRRRRARERFRPVQIPPRCERCRHLRPLQHDAASDPVARELERLIEQRLVRDHPLPFDTARRRDHHHRTGIVDALGELVRREAPEHDRVHGPDARAGEHRHHRLRHHRHVDDHAIAAADALGREGSGEARNTLAELPIGEPHDRPRDRAVVDERRLLAAPLLDVAVERVVAGVDAPDGARLASSTRSQRRSQWSAAARSLQKPSGSSCARRYASR